MDKRKLAALAKKNLAKSGSGTSNIPKGFGKKYDANLADSPVDEATLKEHDRAERFFAEMRKREF